MTFLVTRYAKADDTPDAETDVSSVDAEAFARLLGIPVSRLADVYPLKPEHSAGLRELTGMDLDLDRFDYFLEVAAD
ncbi:hypothetical protein ACFYNL_26430 [Streptomyces sp. NPDC007808]|uniref:DUF7683 domain-containing protein n=1 Tax=Streptomyces sp. NPDC007808 TaxID=3364779 RepID=UPI0036B14B46